MHQKKPDRPAAPNMLPLSITSSLRAPAPPEAVANPWGRTFAQDFPSKAKLFGGSATAFPRHPAGALYQSLRFDQPAKILFVEANTRECFHSPLQFEECEFCCH